MFDERYARRLARRYRRRGLDRTARRIVDLLERRGIRDAAVLEIGGGVGEIQLELLERGAARATNLELSAGYEAEAARLIRDKGVGERVTRRLLDIAASVDAVERADVVVLHRVVCCYPDYRGLLGAAADRTRQVLLFSYPRNGAVGRAAAGAENLVFRLSGRQFRVYAHRTKDMLDVLEEHGLRRSAVHRGAVWQIAALERTPE